MERCEMIVIDKDPNKGSIFDANTGSNLGHPVGLLFCPEFLPPQIHPTVAHDGWITNPVIRWLHHTVGLGFFFFTTISFKDLVYGQSSSHW